MTSNPSLPPRGVRVAASVEHLRRNALPRWTPDEIRRFAAMIRKRAVPRRKMR